MKRFHFFPTSFDLKLGCVASGLWCLLLWKDFPQNGARADLLLFSLFLLAYLIFFSFLSWLSRLLIQVLVALRRVESGRQSWRIQRIFAIAVSLCLCGHIALGPVIPARWMLFAALASACLLIGGLIWYWPARISERLSALSRLSSVTLLFIPLLVGTAFAVPRSLLPALSSAIISKTSDPQKEPAQKMPGLSVKFIGIDGLDMGVIDMLIGLGRLPTFEKLKKYGVSGTLATVSPHSPVVWTSLATGMPESVHKVSDYTTDYYRNTSWSVLKSRFDFLGDYLNDWKNIREQRATSSNERQCKALWEILSEYGKSSLAINWWLSYPAEPVKGKVISNYALPWGGFELHDLEPLSTMPHLSHPPALQAEVLGEVHHFLRNRNIKGLARSISQLEGAKFFTLRDELVFRLYRRYDNPDLALATMYLQSVDTNSHIFSHMAFGPDINYMRPMKLSNEDATKGWEALVAKSYERMDQYLAKLLQNLKQNECLLMVSDHGWEYNGRGHLNAPPGVVFAFGKPFKSGFILEKAHVLNIFPTIAYLLDLPLSRELPAPPLLEAIDPQFQLVHLPAYVDSYERRGARIATSTNLDNEEHLERLKSLGYLQ
ncbi:MAG: alkaline phosphatase family protein [Candidatus Omnitrophica bacterium]|nr:alkaline phosphatase family protein [Candidatus Omnitrophota bacterium]